MRNIATLPLVVLCMSATAGLAIASDDESHMNAPGDNWLTIPQITEKLAAEGYDVRDVEVEDGQYEVYALDSSGNRIEAYVDPLTGTLLQNAGDDDDHDGDDH